MRQGDLILGVDGGGSKTIAWLAVLDEHQHAQVIGRGASGPSNCRSVGYVAAQENLDRSIESAFEDAERTRTAVATACFALAGADRGVEKQQIQSWAEERRVADRLVVTNDAMPVLYAASSEGVGIALISGTGSVAVGRNSTGEVARSGGWGSLLGDEGSGYQIALAGLKAAVRASDGRGIQTSLLQSILQHLQIDDSSDLIPVIYAPETDRSMIAKLAPIVFQAAESDDPVAKRIVVQAAADLTELVVALVSSLGLTGDPISLAISGSVLLNQPKFVDAIQRNLADAESGEFSLARVTDPVAGAVNIAMAK